jgi:hypothetical protein
VVIVEKENVETAVGLVAEESEGLLVKIMYNAVTINQNLVSKFTSDKKVNDFYILFSTIRIDYFGFYLIDCVYSFCSH